MEWNEWDDGDADDPEAHHNRDFEPWPPAPLPPHERTWRHPSELGATTVHVTTSPQPAISRKATVATVAVGVLLVAGAVRLMVPSGAPSSGASSALSIVTSPVDQLTTIVDPAPTPTTPLTTVTVPDVPPPPPPPPETAVVTTTFHEAMTSATPGATDVPVTVAQWTMLGTEDPAYAVVLDEGRYLATSAAAVDGLDLVRLQLPGGTLADAVVVHDDGPIALLGLTADTAAPAPHAAPPDTGEWVSVDAPGGPVDAIVGETNDLGYLRLTSEHPLHESGPVLDDDGTIVGICTRIADADWLVPVLLLDELAAQQPDELPTTSTTTTSPTTSTSASVPTSSTSTTTSTTSTTEPPTTSTTEAPTTSTTDPDTPPSTDESPVTPEPTRG